MSKELPDDFYRADAPQRFDFLVRTWRKETPQAQATATARLRSMPYEEFLSTAYWKTVRDFVVYRWRGTCQACIVNKSTQVHHKTYDHRGQEHLYLNDLMPVCRACHLELEALEGRNHPAGHVRGFSKADEILRNLGREEAKKQEHKTRG